MISANPSPRPTELTLWGWGSPGGSDAHSLQSASRQLSQWLLFQPPCVKGDIHPSQLHTSNSEHDTVPHLIIVSCPLCFFLPCLCCLLDLVHRYVYLIFEPTDFLLASSLIFYLLSLFLGQRESTKTWTYEDILKEVQKPNPPFGFYNYTITLFIIHYLTD